MMNGLASILHLTAPMFAVGESSNIALVSFCLYLGVVVFLAWYSSRSASTNSFVSEYFLGGKSLGVWAFALTFAATAASGGSFVGFPAYIYSHGWVLAFWIAGYMLVPLVAMGLFGKRLNRVGRQADALTIPEVLSKRFDTPAIGAIASLLTVFFIYVYLIAQFDAGSKILGSLLQGVGAYETGVNWLAGITSESKLLADAEPGDLLCLIVFAVAVIGYVVYGGFRAVVWTDVMQGMVMFFGVFIMLVFALQQVGGLNAATRKLADRVPPTIATVLVETVNGGTPDREIRKGEWLKSADGRTIRLAATFDPSEPEPTRAIVLTNDEEVAQVDVALIDDRLVAVIETETEYAFGSGRKGAYVTIPGPSEKKANGFLGVVAAFSFFAFWTFSGAGQPGNMVRLMAFKDTQTLRRSIVTVAFYFSFIYFSLVIVFCIAKTLMPGGEYDADRIMPDFAVFITGKAGVPWLAGLLLAAPFAAVMSSVDSFLLLVSSSLVRDIYQRIINPNASEGRLKAVTYGGTIAIGVAATLGTVVPPPYLQELIVDASAGLSSTFFVPVVISLYWRRMNASGAILGMLSGFFSQVILMNKQLGWGQYILDTTGIQSFLINVCVSIVFVIAGSLMTAPPDERLVQKYFD